MSSTIIEDIRARRVFDSRGSEAIEVEVFTAGGYGRAIAPMGASRGRGEAVPYPPGGVSEAIAAVERLVAPELVGLDAADQRLVDKVLHEVDGTRDFSRIGGNTAYAVSMATAAAAASSLGISLFRHLGGGLVQELPYPLGNVIGGGKHVRGRGPDVQEMLVLPVGATDVLEALQANFLVHRRAGELLAKADPGFTGGRGDEGAWAPKLRTEEALEVLAKACEDVAGELGFEVRMGLDVAASTLWREEENAYVYEREGVRRDRGEQIDFILELVERFKLIYVEDPLAEEDFEGFAELTRKARRLGCLICGDDLFVTDVERIARGAELGAATAIIIKPNQVGTLSDTADAVRAAREAGMVPVASHRSGESTDPHLAHLAVGLRCPIIKTGVLGGERVAKLNELLRIAEELGEVAKMAELPVARG